jgi:hypothetical protein
MPDIRVIAWNIKDFKGSTFTKHGNTILDRIYDATGARLCDVFVIVEPFSKNKKFGVGALVTEGAGLDGVLALYYALAAKDCAWQVVPLRASCQPPKSDMVAVYYYSRLVDFTGPDNIGGIPAVVTKTATPHGHALPWSAATTLAGKIRYYDATPAEINFAGRRPYMVTFNTPERVTLQFTLTVANATPGLGVAAAALPGGVQGSPYLFQLQPKGGTPPYTWTQGGATNLPAGLAFNTATHQLAGTPTANGAFTLQVTLRDSTGASVTATLNLAIAAPGGALAFGTAANLPDAVAGEAYTISLVTKGGVGNRTVSHARKQVTDALPAGMTLAADGSLAWAAPVAGTYTFDVDVVDQTARGFKLMGVHAPPDARYPDNALMVENLANILEITTNRGGVPVAICGDFNVCPIAATPTACYDRQHKVRERDALQKLTASLPAPQRFTSQNANRRTGLKSSDKAGKDAYAKAKATGAVALDDLTSHAYDHALTIGFNAVLNVDTLNLCAGDAGWANAVNDAHTNSNPHPIKGIVRKYLWKDGVSDHYPVKFTLQVT